MAQTPARILFGIHSITPYNRVTKQPYGIMKAVGSASIGLSSDLEKLFAGSNKYPIAAEAKTVDAELSMRVKEYPDFLYELFLGATVTKTAADPTGTIADLANVQGSSIASQTNGIDGIEILDGANLKEGSYVIRATGANTADVFAYSDIDFNRGVDLSFGDDLGKVGSINLTAGDADVTALGITITKVGTPAFKTGDTAQFSVSPPSGSVSEVLIGSAASSFPAFGAFILAQKRATGEITQIEAFNLVASGLPIALEEQAFSQPEVTLSALYDREKDGVFKIRHFTPAG